MRQGCPSVENIAALLDQNLHAEKRNDMMDHMDECEQCHELYAQTMKTQENVAWLLLREKLKETISIEALRGHNPWRYVLLSTVAAACVLLLWMQVWQPEFPLSTGKMAVLLTQQSSAAELLDLADEPVPKTPQAFVSQQVLEKEAVQIGIILMDLELSFLAGNKDKVQEYLHSLNHHLTIIAEPASIVATYQETLQKIRDGVPLQQLVNHNESIDMFFRNHPVAVYFELGKWTESGKLAARAGVPDFLDQADVTYFREQLNPTKAPDKVMTYIELIETIRSKETISSTEMTQLANLFYGIQQNVTP
ncbi:MAG: hypothetical protein HQM14_09850 [SAR324 cluster bacterium]|nr:hypothetical protein [SAR324 cluster bacterium]